MAGMKLIYNYVHIN